MLYGKYVHPKLGSTYLLIVTRAKNGDKAKKTVDKKEKEYKTHFRPFCTLQEFQFLTFEKDRYKLILSLKKIGYRNNLF